MYETTIIPNIYFDTLPSIGHTIHITLPAGGYMVYKIKEIVHSIVAPHYKQVGNIDIYVDVY